MQSLALFATLSSRPGDDNLKSLVEEKHDETENATRSNHCPRTRRGLAAAALLGGMVCDPSLRARLRLGCEVDR